MRKKKLLTKIGILLIGVVFLFQNCQKDFINQEFLELEKGKINILAENEIPQIIDYVNSYTNEKTKNSKTTQTSDIYTYLDVNEIMEVLDTINSTIHRNYSFKMVNIDADPLTFYNLLVITDENTTQEPHIVKYVMNHNFAEQYFSNQVDLDAFQGTVQKIQISDFLENTSLNKTTTNPCEPIDLVGGGGSTGSDAGDYGDGGDTGDMGDGDGGDGDGGDGDGDGNGDGGNGGHYETDCIRVSPFEVRCYTVWVPDYTQRMTADPCDPFGQNEGGGVGINVPDFESTIKEIFINDFFDNLTDEQNECIENDNVLENQINNFLFENINTNEYAINGTDNASVFASKAIDAKCSSGEVDYVENIIIDLDNRPCHLDVVYDAYGICSPLTQMFQNIFENNPNTIDTGYGIIYNVTSPTNNNGGTLPTSRPMRSFDGYMCNIIIRFNENYIDTATDLSIARTTIHETLHAVLIYMLETGAINMANPDPDYVDLVQEYINLLQELPANINLSQHELMAGLVDDIATSLSQYGNDNGYNLPFSYYRKMAWGGLTHHRDANNNLIINQFFIDAVPDANNRIEILSILESEATDSKVNGYEPEGELPNSEVPCD